MSGLDNNDNKKPQATLKKNVPSSLDAAQIALTVGALFGFLAVMGLVVLAWQFALVMLSMAIAMIALMVAVTLLIVPPHTSRKESTPEGEPSSSPKQSGVERTNDFVHSTRQILKSTGEKPASMGTEPGHFSSPLSQTTENENFRQEDVSIKISL
ncbi:MAG: hypothetical protein Q8M03_00610 [Legionella sp.]|nr:hypothetical protein [Legionella sp.]